MDRVHSIAKLAAALSPSRQSALRDELSSLIPEHLSPEISYEIILQCYLFFGYAQAIEACKSFSIVLTEKGIAQETVRDWAGFEKWKERGEKLCNKIYAPNYDRLVRNMADVSPELAAWMVVEGYGKVLSRPGPTELEREIASIVFLALSGHPVQLYSHVRGAKNLGVARTEIVSVIEETPLESDQRKLVLDTVDKVFGS